MRRIVVERTYPSFQTAARQLLAGNIVPQDVQWVDARLPSSLNLFEGAQLSESPSKHVTRVPRAFTEKAGLAIYHQDPQRFDLLYRLLWRLTHGEPRLLDVLSDRDVRRLDLMVKSIRHDVHKMHAFVRFRKVVSDDGHELFVAWHKPEHPIVTLVAPFFVERFAAMDWVIMTPDESAYWINKELRLGEGMPRSAAPTADDMEDLWRTYYASVFNPQRLMVQAMRSGMPLKFWSTLPETQIVKDLITSARKVRQPQITPGNTMPSKKRYPTAVPFLPNDKNLTSLKSAAAHCEGCDLYKDATQTVFGEGSPQAKLMLLGEQPGDQEDLQGRPFVGPAGKLLHQVLSDIGLAQDKVYISNAVKHFRFEPRGKRRIHQRPTNEQIRACRPWLESEIQTLRPAMIVCLGAVAARALLGPNFRLTQTRGEVLTDNDFAPWVMATYHPSALLRADDAIKAQMQEDFTTDLQKAANYLAKLDR